MKKIFILISLVFLLTTFTAKAEDFFSIPDYVSKSDRELLKKARKKIMQENPKCVSVDYGSTVSERSENGNIVQKKGQYFIICDQIKGGGIPSIDKQAFNVFFTKEDILGSKSMADKPAFEEIKSKRICEKAIMNNSLHPSTVDIRRVLGYDTRIVAGNNKRIIYQEFSAKNDFGLKLKYKAECHILPDGKLEAIDISEI